MAIINQKFNLLRPGKWEETLLFGDFAPPRTGKGGMTQSDDMVKWQRHDRMFDISLTFHATAQAIDRICLALFGIGFYFLSNGMVHKRQFFTIGGEEVKIKPTNLVDTASDQK